MRRAFLAVLAASAFVALAGGIALAALRVAEPESPHLATLVPAYQTLVLAFLATAGLGVAFAVVHGSRRVEPAPAPTPAPAPPPPPPAAKPEPDVASVFQQMRTYVDLEMWELALDKANFILQHHPQSREAQVVNKNLNELRWKAEPKFVSRAGSGVSEDEQRSLQEKGLAAMLKHVRTYIELEMWDLAKQKGLAILKHFPDSKEATEVGPLLRLVEQKSKEAVPQPKE